ncbi:hypothetical protein RN001_016020 [Aquatica leii]|uniref:DNA endonuclease RBBP8 n=1 Tax=Aquatica leii TaxID=1421715 RepID=A0AAN7P166_9COLE|nr:hypothetical protein RN001_016020 [Aquatica leii]
MCKSGYEEWTSFFTEEVESLWNTEPSEIRMILILHHILQKEFKRIETSINEKIQTFKHKMRLTSNLEIESKDELPSTQIDIEKLESLEQSPKIKRYRKIKRKKTSNSPSLSSGSKDSPNCSFSLLNSLLTARDKPLNYDCIQEDKPSDEIIDLCNLNDSGDSSCNKKKFQASKLKKASLLNKCNKNIVTQLIDDKAQANGNSRTDNNKLIKDDSSKMNPLSRLTLKSNLFKNYDRIPVKKSVVPEHPHITDRVRCKADKLKLPGWSCKSCQDYYEDFNLTEEQLREKMNICSKHRNKFEPLNQTPKGYWDVTMFSSEED